MGFLLAVALSAQIGCVDGVCPATNGADNILSVPTTGAVAADAEARCVRRAELGWIGHLGAPIGAFEGVGYSSDPRVLPGTCEPEADGLWLAADVDVVSPFGRFRHRSWVRRPVRVVRRHLHVGVHRVHVGREPRRRTFGRRAIP